MHVKAVEPETRILSNAQQEVSPLAPKKQDGNGQNGLQNGSPHTHG